MDALGPARPAGVPARPPVCQRPSCGKPTWNGQPYEYCGAACRQSAVDPIPPEIVCARPGCEKQTWLRVNGAASTCSDEYCSDACRTLHRGDDIGKDFMTEAQVLLRAHTAWLSKRQANLVAA